MIRTADRDELPRIVELWHQVGGPTRRPASVEDALRLVDRDPDALIVADDRGTVVGALIVGWDGWRCQLYRLVVEPKSRRKGIATELVTAAVARAERLGAVTIDARVHLANTGAIRFWEAVGFGHNDQLGTWSTRLS